MAEGAPEVLSVTTIEQVESLYIEHLRSHRSTIHEFRSAALNSGRLDGDGRAAVDRWYAGRMRR